MQSHPPSIALCSCTCVRVFGCVARRGLSRCRTCYEPVSRLPSYVRAIEGCTRACIVACTRFA